MTEEKSVASTLTIEHVSKSFDGHPVVNDVGLTVKAGELAALLGPSGCGKTTLLRAIAGLETPDTGRIALGERQLYSDAPPVCAPPNRRAIGMVFQNYALWPHMTVFRNVAYPLEIIRTTAARKRSIVSAMLAQVQLEGFEMRYPHQLSGGEQQRVALARAIVTRPELLLLDEPLSNLDAHLRKDLRAEIKRVKQETHVTVLHVTHDQTEALALADCLVVMAQGRIEQSGSAEEIYEHPATAFVARFVGDSNLLQVQFVQQDAQVALRLTDGEVLDIDCPADSVWGSSHIAVRPQDISLSTNFGSLGTAGTIIGRDYMGESWIYVVQIGDTQLRVQVSLGEVHEIGDHVSLRLRRAISIHTRWPGSSCALPSYTGDRDQGGHHRGRRHRRRADLRGRRARGRRSSVGFGTTGAWSADDQHIACCCTNLFSLRVA